MGYYTWAIKDATIATIGCDAIYNFKYLMKQFDEIACDTEESYLILDEAMI